MILIVEDDFEIRESLKDVLLSEGYQVEAVNNGKEALGYLQSSPALPMLILLDMMMPVMDGTEFREHQKQNERFLAIPTVMLSADAHLSQKVDRLGVIEYLKKPVELDALLDMVARYATPSTA